MKKLIMILLLCLGANISFGKNEGVVISGRIENKVLDNDILQVYFWADYVYGASKGGSVEIISPINKKGYFHFVISKLNHPGRILIYSKSFGIFFMPWDLAESGDSIFMNIEVKNGSPVINYSGRGSKKYQISNQLDDDSDPGLIASVRDPGIVLKMVDSLLKSKLKMIELNRLNLSAAAYEIIRADIVGEEYSNICKMIQTSYEDSNTTYLWRTIYLNKLDLNVRSYFSSTSDVILSQSKGYIEFSFEKLVVGLTVRNGFSNLKFENLFKTIMNDYGGLVREKLLVYAFSDRTLLYTCGGIDADEFTSYLRIAFEITRNPNLKELIGEQLSRIGKGAPAFDFSLPDSSGKRMSLAVLRGKVVFLDIWGPECGGCLKFKEVFMRDVYPSVKSAKDFVVVSISICKDRNAWLNDLKKYSSPDFINLYTGRLGSNHPLIDYYDISAIPYFLLIDRNGRIFSATIPNVYMGGKAKELLDLFQQALAN
jgi:thiol-disulfide isomerase/thioredoxin